MDSKTRAFLRSKATKLDSVVFIGKEGLTENVLMQIDGVLDTRELIKINILDNSDVNPKTSVEEIAKVLHAQAVTSIGRKMVLYRYSKKCKVHIMQEYLDKNLKK